MPLPSSSDQSYNPVSNATDAVPLGNPFGQVYPPRRPQPAPAVDPRTTALRVLARYIAGLTFYRPGVAGKQPTPFTVQPDRFHIEQADHEQDLVFPCIVATSDEEEEYNSPGLVSDLDETSQDVYGRGTVLQVQYEHCEFIRLELWAASKPERRSLISGLQHALNPTEQMYGVRFAMSDYFGQTVCFTPWGCKRVDSDGVRGRWLARLRVEMRFNVVHPVNYEPLAVPRTDLTIELSDGVQDPIP